MPPVAETFAILRPFWKAHTITENKFVLLTVRLSTELSNFVGPLTIHTNSFPIIWHFLLVSLYNMHVYSLYRVHDMHFDHLSGIEFL